MTFSDFLFSPVEADLRFVREPTRVSRYVIIPPCSGGTRLWGKVGRPAIVLLIPRATMLEQDITSSPTIAEITEMIHTASLVHDDVVDESLFVAAFLRFIACLAIVAILVGDFLLVNWYLPT